MGKRTGYIQSYITHSLIPYWLRPILTFPATNAGLKTTHTLLMWLCLNPSSLRIIPLFPILLCYRCKSISFVYMWSLLYNTNPINYNETQLEILFTLNKSCCFLRCIIKLHLDYDKRDSLSLIRIYKGGGHGCIRPHPIFVFLFIYN